MKTALFDTENRKTGKRAAVFFIAVFAALALCACVMPGCAKTGDIPAPDTESAASASDGAGDGIISAADTVLPVELPVTDSDVSAADADGEYIPPIDKTAKEGDIFCFGSYPQSGGQLEPIEWRVLKKEKDRALVISERILDCKPYNKESIKTTWSDCTLREWLNNDFLNTAFTPRERKGILLVTNKPASKTEMKEFGEVETEDYIFCLSTSEAKKYFKKDKDRLAAPTEYAKKHGCWVNEKELTSDGLPATWWLLRSQGASGDHMFMVAIVHNNGELDEYGRDVSDTVSVRPAFWIDLEG